MSSDELSPEEYLRLMKGAGSFSSPTDYNLHALITDEKVTEFFEKDSLLHSLTPDTSRMHATNKLSERQARIRRLRTRSKILRMKIFSDEDNFMDHIKLATAEEYINALTNRSVEGWGGRLATTRTTAARLEGITPKEERNRRFGIF